MDRISKLNKTQIHLSWLFLFLVMNGCNSNYEKEVGIWDKFEISVINQNKYEDPFRDVTLEAEFFKPNGETVSFWGFYDGENTWKVRFMPDYLGEWKYKVTFSDGSHSKNGKFICKPSDIPGMIYKDEINPIWFGFKGGEHFFMRSFHAGDRFFAANWDDPNNDKDGNKRSIFLDWFQMQGYNTISIASHYLNRETENRGKDWDTPALWPLDPLEYKKMETLLDELSQRKIIVYPFAGFFGQSAT